MNTHPRADRRPPACHYDRQLRMRVTRRHADDCPSLNGSGPCPAADRGCQPCDAPHCLVCGRTHATAARPDTCVDCETKIATDLADIATAYNQLDDEATHGGGDGRLAAAAPIPGGDATVLRGPTVPIAGIRVGRHVTPDLLAEDHRRKDPMPPLAIVAHWEDIYRAWLDHTTRTWRAASVPAAVTYLRDQLPYLANHATSVNDHGVPAPDWLTFTRQIRTVRAELENRLHDERDDEQGVSCFECGDALVRRFRPRQACRHTTPAREHLKRRLLERPAALALIDRLIEVRMRRAAGDRTATAESIGRLSLWPTSREHAAACLPSPAELAAAKLPCPDCSQGGIDDPAAGRSWECPGCRKIYDRAEYAYAVRSSVTSGDGSGWWATVQAAADAASDVTGRSISAATIRTWIERGDAIAVACMWTPPKPGRPGVRFGVQIVSWPDVLARATEQRARGRRSVAAS